MSAQPDMSRQIAAAAERALLRAVAEVVIEEERARAAADREIAADLKRLRDRIEEYGTIIDLKVAAATAHLKDGKDGTAGLPGPAGDPGVPGERGPEGPAGPPGESGERGATGEPAYPGRACGLYSPSEAYRAMDVVAHNGSEWRAVRDDPGPLPGDGWALGAKGSRGKPGDKGDRGPPGPEGRGIADLDVAENGETLVVAFTDGTQRSIPLVTR
jgi:Collagen triple helix repeat (20 copies)